MAPSLASAPEEAQQGRSWYSPEGHVGQTVDERTFACLKQVSVANLAVAVVPLVGCPPMALVDHAVLPMVGEKGVP